MSWPDAVVTVGIAFSWAFGIVGVVWAMNRPDPYCDCDCHDDSDEENEDEDNE